MTLGALYSPKAAVKVPAVADKVDRDFLVEVIEAAEKSENADGAAGEARVLLAPLVPGEGTSLRILQREDPCKSRQGPVRFARRLEQGEHAHETILSLLSTSSESCMARIWTALRVEWMCASWPG